MDGRQHPDHVIFVMDASIGQAAHAQATAFREAIDIGSVILTKLDGHAKGGGALSAVAATSSPILFIGTGEHMDDLDRFEAKGFVSKMLGMGDLNGLVEQVKSLQSKASPDTIKRLEKGLFTLRDMYDQFQTIQQMGPITKLMGSIPGFSPEMLQGQEGEVAGRFKKMMVIMDSMTAKEMDGDEKPFEREPTRVTRIALGSGNRKEDVELLLAQYKMMCNAMKAMGGAAKGRNPHGGKAAMRGGTFLHEIPVTVRKAVLVQIPWRV